MDKLDLILQELQSLNHRVSNIESNMATKEDVADLPAIKRAAIELSEKANEILNEQESAIQVLNRRVFKVESELEKLTKQ